MNVGIRHLYISPGHNYFGRHNQPAGENPILEVDRVHCLAGRGIEGDRFCDWKSNYKGQITFFEWEVYQNLGVQCGVTGVMPSVFRRNVVTEGIDLNALIGSEFEIQGVMFKGTEECRPCHWMDEAFHPGAEERLRGHGGLRAKILTNGWISTQ